MRRLTAAVFLACMLWSAPALAQTPAPQAPVVTTSNDRIRVVGFIGIIVLAVVYLRLADQPPREPKSLVKFGQSDEEPGE